MPPFGFGFSMPNVRKAAGAAPFVPVTLVQENWPSGAGGLVSGRTPSPISGGGTWQIVATEDPLFCEYAAARVNVEGGGGTFRHSVALTDATIAATVTMDGDFPSAAQIWARSNPGPTSAITSGYFLYVAPSFVTLNKRVAGVDSQIGSATVEANDVVNSLTVSGSTITVIVNGVQVIQVTDTDVSAAGYFGCYAASAYGLDSYVYAYIGALTIKTA